MNWLGRIFVLGLFLFAPKMAEASFRLYGGPDGVYSTYTGSTRSANTIYWTFFHFDDLYPAYPSPGFFHAQLSGTAGGQVNMALYKDTGAAPYTLLGISAPQTAVPGHMTFSIPVDPISLCCPNPGMHLKAGDYAVAMYVESGLIGPMTNLGQPFDVARVSIATCQDPFSDASSPSLTDWGLYFGVYMEGLSGGTITNTYTPTQTAVVCGACAPTQTPTRSVSPSFTRTYKAGCQVLSNTPTPTPTVTVSASSTPTGSSTCTLTPSMTTNIPSTRTITPSCTVTASFTLTASPTATVSSTFSNTASITAKASATVTATFSATAGPCLSCSATATSALPLTPLSGSISYPAPANNSMTLAFNLPLAGRVKVEIYALSGSLLGQIQADLGAGNQTLLVNLSAYAGGVYAYRLIEDLPSGTIVLPLQTFMIARP